MAINGINSGLGSQNTGGTGLLSSLRTQNESLQKTSNKLSSGYRINQAADDAVNMAVSEKMWAQISAEIMAMGNTQDAVSFVGAAEGGMSEISNMLNRMQELAVQGSNGILNDSQRGILQKEMDSILTEIDRIAQGTNFNGKNMLDGSLDPAAGGSEMVFQIGDSAHGFQQIDVAIEGMTSENLGVKDVSLSSASDSLSALNSIRSAIDMVSSGRGNLGAVENRLQHAYKNLGVTNENMIASNSRIKDADMAKEWMNFTKDNMLSQSKMAVASQSNMHAAQILQLLG